MLTIIEHFGGRFTNQYENIRTLLNGLKCRHLGEFRWYKDNAQSIKFMFDKDFKHDASKIIFARWQAQLAPFDYEIQYKKGSENSLPDFLSREHLL